MAESVKMPALGESVTEGTVSSWLKSVGDTVEVGEPLLEVATDKVDTEVPSPVAGTLLEIRVAEDENAEVGAVLAIVGDPAEAGGAPAEPAPAASTPQEEPVAPAPAPAAAPVAVETAAPDAPPSAGYVTPIVRKLARERGVDLTTVTGTGVGGRIRKQDVEAAAAAQAEAAAAAT
ncbi:biotin/lipoyl-containing protein, partial [Actinomyces ruminis]